MLYTKRKHSYTPECTKQNYTFNSIVIFTLINSCISELSRLGKLTTHNSETNH